MAQNQRGSRVIEVLYRSFFYAGGVQPDPVSVNANFPGQLHTICITGGTPHITLLEQGNGASPSNLYNSVSNMPLGTYSMDINFNKPLYEQVAGANRKVTFSFIVNNF